ncbi:TrkH family potassium uptake protein [Thalassospira sp. NFXS8]|uniref:TrkH family potassium uptake protein n=1 Tax=unclassified Thalassospira TaxID=2648997 RepID=UPI0032DEA761
MIDFRPILFIIGILLATLAIGMIVPALVDLYYGHPDWLVFSAASAVSLFIGGALVMMNRTEKLRMTSRQAFILTTASWLVLTAVSALPFSFSNMNMSYTDAFFEAMSGISTTGSTVMVGLDTAPPGILLWRALLQWLGGIGIIVMAIAVMPMLRVGGMQLFRMENSDKSDKAFPRATQIAMGIFTLYVVFTVIWTFLLWWAGMSFFDAIAHAMTTIATGGFSTKDASVGYYDNPLIDVIITLGMTTGALPFLLYLQTLRGRPLSLFRDSQVRWFVTLALTIILSVAFWHSEVNGVGFWTALRFSSFNIISVMTGTGFATTDYGLWGAFAVAVFFFVMFVGGCAGSTTCGVKIFRLQVLYEIAKIQLNHMLRPHGVFIAYYNGKPLTEDVTESVLSFFFLFVFCFVVLAAGLGAMGLDFVTAISSAGTAIANVGPGLGPIVGPSGNFATLPDGAKWMMSVGMLIGRLEVFTVLILLSPDFWRD